MKFMSEQILVTGGTGYIGSHTVVELQKEGFEVVIVDNLSNSTMDVLDRIKQITGIRPAFEKFDLCDRQLTSDFFNKYRDIFSVIHFAAHKAVGESVKQPLKYYNNNINSLLNIVDVLTNFPHANLIFSSSCTVYGQPEILPVTEQSQIQKALSPYGNTKQICEEIIADTIDAGNSLNAIVLRYFNPIGAHESALIGELPLGVPDNLVPYVTQVAAGIRPELKIFGDNYNTPDGSCIRDYIHVVDLAKAHVSAIKRLIDKKNKTKLEIFNLGTGQGTSVLEVVKTFEKVVGIKLNYRIVDKRQGDIEQIWADSSYANMELGWKTEKTLQEALLSAWNWEKYYRTHMRI